MSFFCLVRPYCIIAFIIDCGFWAETGGCAIQGIFNIFLKETFLRRNLHLIVITPVSNISKKKIRFLSPSE